MAITLNGDTGITTPAETIQGNLTTTGNTILGDASTDTLNVGNGGLVKDASGNVGVGITPSALVSTGGGSGNIAIAGSLYTDDGINLCSNFQYLSGYKFYGTGYAAQNYFDKSTGGTYWRTSTASGTAGNTVTWSSPAMTLDASGNLGINGQTSPGTFQNAGLTIGTGVTNYGVNIYSGSSAFGDICFAKASSGVGLYNGMIRYSHASDYMSFWTASTERARIDASGNLLVNASSQFNSGKVCVQDNLSVSNLVALKSTVSWVTGTYYLVGVNSSGSFIGGINQASQTTLNYATSSDERLKDNIVDAPSALESIENIRIRSFDWKEDGIHQKFGVVAQEVLSIVPEAVSVGRNEEDMMGVDYSKFVPRLIKAIQEQQAMIDELKAKVAALEAA